MHLSCRTSFPVSQPATFSVFEKKENNNAGLKGIVLVLDVTFVLVLSFVPLLHITSFLFFQFPFFSVLWQKSSNKLSCFLMIFPRKTYFSCTCTEKNHAFKLFSRILFLFIFVCLVCKQLEKSLGSISLVWHCSVTTLFLFLFRPQPPPVVWILHTSWRCCSPL